MLLPLEHPPSLQNTPLCTYQPPNLFFSCQHLWLLLIISMCPWPESLCSLTFFLALGPKTCPYLHQSLPEYQCGSFPEKSAPPTLLAPRRHKGQAWQAPAWCGTPRPPLLPAAPHPLTNHRLCEALQKHSLKRTQVIPQALSEAVGVGKASLKSLCH